jgi:hypothetical protein
MALSWTQQIDDMFTTTWANRKTSAVEQAYMKTPFIYWLKQKGKVEEMKGYTRIEVPLKYGKNETVRWIKKGSTMPLTEGQLFSMAYEEWRYVAVSLLRYGIDDQKNRGAARIINYVDEKISSAESAMWEEFERVVFSDGSGTDEINGLQNLIDATGGATTNTTVHGIDRSTATGTNTWFQNQTKTATGAFSVYGISDMRNMMNNLTKYAKTEVKDFCMMTDQTTFEAFEDMMLDMKQFFNQDLIDAGFENLVFKGRPLMWAPSAPSAKMYFINPNYLKLVIDPDYFMDMTSWKEIPDQVNDRVAQIVCAMNFITTRPIAEGILTGITY